MGFSKRILKIKAFWILCYKLVLEVLEVIRNIGLNVDTVRLSGSLKKLKEELSFIQSIGITLAEIPPAGLSFIFNGTADFQKSGKVFEILRGFDLYYTIHMPDPLNLALERSEDLSIALTVVNFAKAIKAKVVVYHCGSNLNFGSVERESEQLKILAKELGKDNIFLGIENLDHNIEWILELLKRVDFENVGLVLDVGHLFLYCKGNERLFLSQLSLGLSESVELHIHDNFGKPSVSFEKDIANKNYFAYLFGVGDLHLPLRMGAIPWSEVFRLVNDKFDGYVILEINDFNRFSEDIPSSIQILRENLRQS